MDLLKGKKIVSIGDKKHFIMKFSVELPPESINGDVSNILKWNDAKITRVEMGEY